MLSCARVISVILILIGLLSLGNLGINQTAVALDLSSLNDLRASPLRFAADQSSNLTSSSGLSSTGSFTTAAASSSTISASSTTTTSSTQTTASSSTSSTSSTTSLTSVSQTKTTTVTVPSISLDPASGSVGLTVDVSGTGFSTGTRLVQYQVA